jgi:protocatechuate 3,4-dioxygenase beta subunit
MAWFGQVVKGALLVGALLAGEPASAQGGAAEPARVVGRVTDGAGNPVKDATLELVADADGTRAIASSGETGGFEFARVAAGTYTLRTERAGFAQGSTRVTVAAGERRTVIARLRPGRPVRATAIRQ